MKKINFVIIIAFLVASCTSSSDKDNNQKAENPATAASAPHANDSSAIYTAKMVNNDKDLVCGMPVSAGIGDTAHYQGKVYGFCSKECKDDFIKNPIAYLPKK
ncbi:MAG: YHS domain-containing protein [Bacteroidota bacterium]|jgi:YHS domain-containing protein|nr:YHS domain-containing protein [Bacteroidota bacterium]